VGHGWVEGGPLLPVKNEYYQSGLAVEALRALSDLARMIGKNEISTQLSGEFERARPVLDQAFWSPEINSYAFAQKQDGERSNEASVLTTVPIWFGLSEETHADQTISRLAEEDHETDWGMRIISNRSKVYDGSGYHFGSVWPLFTGWASVAEYKYHRAFPAYANLRANALLGFDGALGHFSEVLSGDYNQSFSTSSPHQIWSAAMVISPILRGMLGLETDAEKHQIRFAPHLPADWTAIGIRNLHVAGSSVDFHYAKTADSILLDMKRTGDGECWVEFSPAFALRTHVVTVEMNGHKLPFKMLPNHNDQHLNVRFKMDTPSARLLIQTRNDFGISFSNDLPPLGSGSQGLRVVSEEWNEARSEVTLTASGLGGRTYELSIWNPAQVASVDGGVLTKAGRLEIHLPDGSSEGYVHQKVVLHFEH
jgi:Amylo-alpha-1,6-glucosidase